MKAYIRSTGFVIALAAAFSAVAWGQATTSLRGTVTDPSGAVIPGASVTLTNAATNLSRATETEANGEYYYAAVLPGAYNLTVGARGFHTFVQKGLQLFVNLPATANVRLQVGAVSQTVEVTSAPPVLNTTDASVGHTMSALAISQLPLRAENMPLLLSFQAGVVYNGDKLLEDSYDTRAGSVNGERSDQNNITLDGVSVNNEFAGYAFNGVLPTTQFSVQEFRVTTSNYGATQGRSAGAQIAMVTKGGTNQFHGSLYEFNRSDAGEANDYFLKLSQLANGQPNVPEKLTRNVFGGTFGGPILKNRFFFFVNYEGHRQASSTSVLRTIPSATLRQGIIEYACATPSQCPGGTVAGATGQGYPIQPGYYALGPAQLKQMDPLGIGPSQVALNYFNTYPLPNDFSTIDVPNYAGYRFGAPTLNSDNYYIGRLDYKLTESGNQTLFFRWTSVDDPFSDVPFLPGRPPQDVSLDLSKGFVAGYTAILSPRWVNNFRYGLTRQSVGVSGTSSLPWIGMRDLDQGITRPYGDVDPVHDIVDTMSGVMGSHNFQFGGDLLLIRRHSYTTGNSFSDALTNADWLISGGFANTNDPLNPAYGCAHSGPCFPAVATDFNHSYDFPLAAMMGIASEVDAQYNYSVVNETTASPLAQGAPVVRNWATDSYNLFAEDTWRVRHNLSISYGLNYQLMTPLTETSGQEVTPSVNMGAWFNQRAANMEKGIGSNQDALIQFSPAGAFYGKPGLYSAQLLNFAPRVGVAWAPDPSSGWLKRLTGDHKTSIRAGFGRYDDNFGPALGLSYDASGSVGLTTSLSSPAHTQTVASAPRITNMNVIPTTDNNGATIMPAAPPSTYPFTYPVGSEGIAYGIDQSFQTPYSYAADFS
ncbi:MAG: carboxypeptidase regulatory-like domain-containing protein, partial [Terriglobia bacterium]